jgi:hypothetical protein
VTAGPGEPLPAHHQLERRYRRLLAWYPADHRNSYDDEMLAVLLDGAEPDQRYPRPGEAANLLWSATRRRLGQPARTWLPGSPWGDAAAVFGTLALLVLVGTQARELVGPLPYGVGWLAHLSWREWLPLAVWLGAMLAALIDWRVGAVVAWTAAVLLVAPGVVQYAENPMNPLLGLRGAVLGAITAAALSVPGGVRRGAAVLGRRGIAAAVLAGVVAAGSAAGPALVSVALPHLEPGPWIHDALLLLPHPTVLALLLFAALGTPAPVRRRLLTITAPTTTFVGGLQLMVGHEFRMPASADSIAALEWLALATAPVLVLLLGLGALRRWDGADAA